MGTTLDEGQIEMVMMPMKKVNKLNDTFKTLKTRVSWVKLPSLSSGHSKSKGTAFRP